MIEVPPNGTYKSVKASDHKTNASTLLKPVKWNKLVQTGLPLETTRGIKTKWKIEHRECRSNRAIQWFEIVIMDKHDLIWHKAPVMVATVLIKSSDHKNSTGNDNLLLHKSCKTLAQRNWALKIKMIKQVPLMQWFGDVKVPNDKKF